MLKLLYRSTFVFYDGLVNYKQGSSSLEKHQNLLKRKTKLGHAVSFFLSDWPKKLEVYFVTTADWTLYNTADILIAHRIARKPIMARRNAQNVLQTSNTNTSFCYNKTDLAVTGMFAEAVFALNEVFIERKFRWTEFPSNRIFARRNFFRRNFQRTEFSRNTTAEWFQKLLNRFM